MEDDRELARDRDGGLLGRDPRGRPCAPGLQGRPLRDAMEDHAGGLEQVAAEQAVAAARDAAGVVLLARLAAPRCQAEVGAHTGGAREAPGVVDGAGLDENPGSVLSETQ